MLQRLPAEAVSAFCGARDDNWEEHLGSSDRVVTLAEMLSVSWVRRDRSVETAHLGCGPSGRRAAEWVKWDGLRPNYEEEEEE